MSDAGFEPASANTRALKAPPLDQALVIRQTYNSYNPFDCDYILLIRAPTCTYINKVSLYIV